ncbi:MAG: LacI family DNA-binding transcriptional regulator [Kiloniellaceae bacterium]
MHRAELAKTRLSDVAKLAGVSAATVSRAINSPEKVSAALRQRVTAAVDQLHYVPHGAARALASRRSRTIGAVVPTLDIAIFAAGVAALQNRLHASGYTLLVANAEYDLAKEAQQVRALLERGVDGLVLVGGLHLPEVYNLLQKNRVPFVNTYNFGPEAEHPCIGINHYLAAYRVIEYLLDLGHRRFGMITSPVRNNDRIKARRDGFLDALRDHDLPLPAARAFEVPYTIADGGTALRSLLGIGAGVTAVTCTADMLAIGALQECRALGVRVPGEVSVTGFDDLDLAMHLDPPLTTVRIPAAELGRRAGDYLLARINGRAVPHRVELSAHLIVRGSTGRPGG